MVSRMRLFAGDIVVGVVYRSIELVLDRRLSFDRLQTVQLGLTATLGFGGVVLIGTGGCCSLLGSPG
jgi:hypothetical protein